MHQIPTSTVAHLVKTTMAVEDWKRDTFDAMNKNVAAHNVLATEAFTKKTEILSHKNFYGSINIKCGVSEL